MTTLVEGRIFCRAPKYCFYWQDLSAGLLWQCPAGIRLHFAKRCANIAAGTGRWREAAEGLGAAWLNFDSYSPPSTGPSVSLRSPPPRSGEDLRHFMCESRSPKRQGLLNRFQMSGSNHQPYSAVGQERLTARLFAVGRLSVIDDYYICRYTQAMTTQFKLKAIGNSVGLILPKEELARLGVGKGDALSGVQTPNGIGLRPYDPDFEAQMKGARDHAQAASSVTRIGEIDFHG